MGKLMHAKIRFDDDILEKDADEIAQIIKQAISTKMCGMMEEFIEMTELLEMEPIPDENQVVISSDIVVFGKQEFEEMAQDIIELVGERCTGETVEAILAILEGNK